LKYYYTFEKLKEKFEEDQMIHISQEVNDKADELAWQETSPKPGQLKMFILHLVLEPSVSGKERLRVEENPSGWKKEIVECLSHETLPTDKGKAKKLRTQTTRYTLVADELYKKGFSSTLLKCLDQDQANYVLQELHEGV